MTNLFQIADLNDSCGGLLPIFKVIRKGIFPIIWIGIPILIILMGTVDLGKAVLASDDKEIKGATGRLIKRIVYGVVIFFMATIVGLVMDVVTTAGDDVIKSDWRSCWNAAGE
ncbi:MAG: hypothetical protein IKO49_08330 [Bacilli bacterium]|nr:hypothetical protein [Bacilli bacterium]